MLVARKHRFDVESLARISTNDVSQYFVVKILAEMTGHHRRMTTIPVGGLKRGCD